MLSALLLVACLLLVGASAFAPAPGRHAVRSYISRPPLLLSCLNDVSPRTCLDSSAVRSQFSHRDAATPTLPQLPSTALAGLFALTLTLALAPLPAAAADSFSVASNAIPSALAAYGHYLGLVLVSGCLVTERLLIKPAMSVQEEKLLGYADIVYGLAGVLVLASGYFRVTEYGKGWEFYSHEPVFWIKMLLFSVMGASSLFLTIKIIQRAVSIKNAEDSKEGAVMPAPLSEKLAK